MCHSRGIAPYNINIPHIKRVAKLKFEEKIRMEVMTESKLRFFLF